MKSLRVKTGSQQETNYYLADLIAHSVANNQQEHADIIKLIAELDEQIIWFGAGPPEIDKEKYKFWWDTEALELLINYNDQWFPVAIPPAQVETLRATIDGIMDDVTRVKSDIILNKADIDTLAVDVDGKLATLEEELEQLAPSLERGSWNLYFEPSSWSW